MYYLNSCNKILRLKHLLKIIVSVFFFVIFFFGCKKQRTIKNTTSKITKIKSELPSIKFSKKVYTFPKQIGKQAHTFSPEITFKEIYVYKNKKNETYTFVWVVDPLYTNFDELSKWKIGMILKPQNRADFEDKTLQEKGIKTMGVLTIPVLINDKICIVLRDFKFKPTEIVYSKFYLYNEKGKVNLNYWIIENISLYE